jgi:hypothetical protein
LLEKIAAESVVGEGGKKGSVRRPGKEMQGAPKHAEFSDWRDGFHAALVRGGERSWISAAVSRSMTFIGPPQSGQR